MLRSMVNGLFPLMDKLGLNIQGGIFPQYMPYFANTPIRLSERGENVKKFKHFFYE